MTPAPASPPSLVVAETFGPTIAGEGPSLGRRASFIRLGGCDLRCTWCDTPYTWNAARYDLRAELTRVPAAELAARALHADPGLVVLTGGEPLLHQHQPGWTALLDALTEAGADIEVETNGTRAPTPATAAAVTRFNVSPKLAHAGDPEHKRIRPRALTDLAALAAAGQADFKFVCRDPADVDQAAGLAAAYGIPPRQVWIMPEGTTTTAINHRLAQLADPAIARGFNLTTRLHIACWGDERGH